MELGKEMGKRKRMEHNEKFRKFLNKLRGKKNEEIRKTKKE